MPPICVGRDENRYKFAPMGRGRLSRVGFSPYEEQSRHSRAGGNPEPPQSTRLRAWMPACAGTTDQKTQA